MHVQQGFTEISIALTSFSEVLFVSGVGHQTGAEADAVDVRRAYVGLGSVIVSAVLHQSLCCCTHTWLCVCVGLAG